jgi:uncharacterized protein
MTVELRPLGVKCNIQCQYCYQNPQRDAGNVLHRYDLDLMMKAVEAEGGPFSLFGGEPLLLPMNDLERLLEWGITRFGQNSLQTNGALITDEHIRLFKQYKVHVGLSIDGPGELNDARWAGGVERTREVTARVEAVIEQLCREQIPPTLIVTLHRGNATAAKLPLMHTWLKSFQAMGVRSARLHLLEVDHAEVRRTYAMTPDENRAAIRSFAALESELTSLRLDLFEDARRMLVGDDDGVTCVWGACDPYTTSAVRGIEGNGQRSNCGRTNKDGIDFTKAADEGFERYLALYHTPQEHGGCQGCRFFLFCKGQCPGTALDNDWRNRSEHCPVWMETYERVERELVGEGKEPLSLSKLRQPLEDFFLSAWKEGHNTTLAHALGVLRQRSNGSSESVPDKPATSSYSAGEVERLDFQLHSFTRIAWASDAARDVWAPRLERLRKIGPELEWRSVAAGARPCAVIFAPQRPEGDACAPWVESGLTSARLDGGRVLVGRADHLAALQGAMTSGDDGEVGRLLGHPDCCRAFFRKVWVDEGLLDPTWAVAAASISARRETDDAGETLTVEGSPGANVLWRWLGVRFVPHTPCGFDCPATTALAEQVAAVARASGLEREAEWMTEILSWPVEWSALHGIAEIRTPVLKISTRTDATARRYRVRWLGREGRYPHEGGRGVRFPYVTPEKPLFTASASYQRGLENSAAGASTGASADEAAIHREALAELEVEGQVAGRSLRGVHLTPYFTVVELDDGGVGAGMSYYHEAEGFQERVPAASAADPLLLRWLFGAPDPAARLGGEEDQARHLIRSLRTAILAALAAPLMKAGAAGSFSVSETAPPDLFAGARRAVVIGFGGYMDRLAAAPEIEHLHVCDLGYSARAAEMESAADGYRSRQPAKRITLSDGRDAEARIKASDVVAITGSALCNGTMEQLLGWASGGPAVVVQGQSGAIHPLPLFRRGVRVVATTRKPLELARQAAADPTGRALLPFLEGGLPWIYLTPAPINAGLRRALSLPLAH